MFGGTGINLGPDCWVAKGAAEDADRSTPIRGDSTLMPSVATMPTKTTVRMSVEDMAQ